MRTHPLGTLKLCICLPFAALSGGLLLLVADAVGRTVIAPAVVPVGIVVAFIGGPVFIYLILTRRNTLK